MSFKVGDIVRVKDYKDIDCSTFCAKYEMLLWA